jgi:hypothetical protein
MIVPSRMTRKAIANPVKPYRMRCALLPGWWGIAIDEAMARFDNMQARGLDGSGSGREGTVMTRTSLLLTLAAAAALAGCQKHTIVSDPNKPDEVNTTAGDNANVQLPPSIIATKLYRCADNSVVTVDYLSDSKSANVRTGKDAATSTQVTTDTPGKPMTAAGGYSVEGSATASSAKIAVPGHPAQTCNA